MKKIVFANRFVKEHALMKKRGKDLNKLQNIVELLKTEQRLPSKYKDHKLIGQYEGSRELHIEPDWLLIYKVENQSLILERTGTHSDLFKK